LLLRLLLLLLLLLFLFLPRSQMAQYCCCLITRSSNI
jgi:hypothetical protein